MRARFFVHYMEVCYIKVWLYLKFHIVSGFCKPFFASESTQESDSVSVKNQEISENPLKQEYENLLDELQKLKEENEILKVEYEETILEKQKLEAEIVILKSSQTSGEEEDEKISENIVEVEPKMEEKEEEEKILENDPVHEKLKYFKKQISNFEKDLEKEGEEAKLDPINWIRHWIEFESRSNRIQIELGFELDISCIKSNFYWVRIGFKYRAQNSNCKFL